MKNESVVSNIKLQNFSSFFALNHPFLCLSLSGFYWRSWATVETAFFQFQLENSMMERDFMGLNSKESVGMEEVVESCKNSEYTKGSGVCNKGPTYPHSAYSGSMATPSADAFDTSYKNQSCGLQTIIGASSKPQIFGGVPVSVPHQSLPSSSILAGTTDSRYNAKATGSGPAQLTIFYGGKVNVFNEITPEKAQAIMILAGNHSLAQNIDQKRLQVLSPTDKLAAKDPGFKILTVNNPSPNSALSSPISVSSHPVGRIGGSPTRNDEYKQSKTTGISTNIVSKVEPSTLMVSLGPVASPTMIPSAVPQFRKASLARFLEKRKERAINSAPYNLMKKTSGNSIPESQAAGGSASAASVGGSISPLTS